MEILVINGSPKWKNSVTLQTVNYLRLRFPDHNFQLLHAGQTVIEAREILTRPPVAGRRMTNF